MKILTGEKILIGPSSFSVMDRMPMDRLVEVGCEVINNPFRRKLTKSELADLLARDVTGLIAGLEPLDREVLGNSSLKVISRCGGMRPNVDLAAAAEFGIKVFFTPDAPTQAVAELTLGVMINLQRMIPKMDRDLHNRTWSKEIGAQLEETTVVIIGFGRIGRRLAELLAPFNAKILAVDPYIQDPIAGIPLLPLEEALREADIITIHSGGEARILGDEEFKLVKKDGAFLLNAARGIFIDEAALIRAIEGGRIRGAWIDVFEEEPYAGALTRYPQVILTPHVSTYTRECRKRMEIEAVENLIKAFKERR